jgi:hypothetical protein
MKLTLYPRIVLAGSQVEDSPPQPSWVVTLVHGTFASNSAWTRPGSYLSTQLRQRLTDSAVEIRAFTWSGCNSESARREAASELRAHLQQMICTYPAARHYVVGHSHGGTVALQGVYADDAFARQVAGVATLATPFIQVRKRDTRGLDHRLLGWWTSALTVVGLVNQVEKWIFVWSQPSGLALWLLLVGWLGAMCLGVGLTTAFAAAPCDGSEKATELFGFAVPSWANLLIVRTSGDEASAFLASSQLLAWSVTYLSTFLQRWALPLLAAVLGPSLRRRFVAALSVVFLNLWMFLFVQTFPFWRTDLEYVRDWDGPLLRDGLFLWVLAWVPTLLLGAATLLGWVLNLVLAFLLLGRTLLWFLALPFGAGISTLAPGSQLSVEAVPEGAWRVHQFSPTEEQGQGLQLVHGASYDDPRVVDLITSWMREGTNPSVPSRGDVTE